MGRSGDRAGGIEGLGAVEAGGVGELPGVVVGLAALGGGVLRRGDEAGVNVYGVASGVGFLV